MKKDSLIQLRINSNFKDLVNQEAKIKNLKASEYITSLIVRDMTDNIFSSFNEECEFFIKKKNIIDVKIKNTELQLIQSEGFSKKIHMSNLEKLIKEKEDLINQYKK